MVSNPFREGISVEIRGDASDLNNSIDDAKRGLTDLKKATALTGAALAGLAAGGLAVAVNEARKFETAMVELEKVTNAETVEEMSGAIMEMAETIPLGQKALADIAADAGRFGVRGPENIRNFTESVAKMSSATDLSASRAGEALAKLATLTGTPITEVENLGSSINELSNNFATSAGEIVDSMLRSSAAMTQFGLSQTEIAGMSAALNAVSESSERAGTRMRRVVQELSNPKKFADVAAALGVTVQEFQAMKKNDPAGLLMELARLMKEGGKGADILNKNLSTTTRQALSGLGQNLDGVNKALGMSADAYKENVSLQNEFEKSAATFDSQLKLLQNRLRNTAIAAGNVLLPPLTELLRIINSGITAISDMKGELGGVTTVITLVSTMVVGLAHAFKALAGSAAAAKLAPYVAALARMIPQIAILTTVLTGLTMAWKNNWFGIRDITKSAIADIKVFISELRTEFKDTMEHLAPDIQAALNTVRLVIKNTLSLLTAIWEGDTQAIRDAWSALWESVRVLAKQGLLILRDAVVWGMSDIVQAATKAFDGFPQSAAQMFTDLTNAFVTGFTALGLEILGFKKESKGQWKTAMAGWKNAVDVHWPLVKGKLVNGLNGLKKSTKQATNRLGIIWGGLWGLFPKPIRQAWTKVKNSVNQAWTFLTTTFNKIRSTILGTSNKIRSDTTSTWNKITSKIRMATNFIKNTIINPFMGWMMKQWNKHGKVVVKELNKTINAWIFQFNRAKNAIMSILNPFLNWARRTWHDTMWKVKKDLQTIWNGVKSDFNGLVTFLRKALNRFKKDFITVWNGVQKDFNKFVNWFMGAARSTLNWLAKQWDKHGDEIISIVSFFLDTIKGTVEFGFNALRTLAVVILRGLRGDIKGVWREIKRFIKSTLDGLTGFLNHWGGKAKQWASGTFNAMRRRASDAINGLKRSVKRTIDNLIGDMRRSGRGMIDAFAGGIKDRMRAVKNAVSDIVQAARDRLPGSDAKEGPLSDLTASGEALGKTFAKGIKKGTGDVEGATFNLAGAAVPQGNAAPNVTNMNITVQANSHREGRAAGRGLADELRSRGFNS